MTPFLYIGSSAGLVVLLVSLVAKDMLAVVVKIATVDLIARIRVWRKRHNRESGLPPDANTAC